MFININLKTKKLVQFSVISMKLFYYIVGEDPIAIDSILEWGNNNKYILLFSLLSKWRGRADYFYRCSKLGSIQYLSKIKFKSLT